MGRKKGEAVQTVIVTDYGTDYKLVRPAEGYKLFDIAAWIYVSEAVVKPEDVQHFEAVKK